MIDKDFSIWLHQFAKKNNIYFVTGSDRDKTLEQLTVEVYNLAVRSYQCNGSDVYEKDKLVYKSDWVLPDEVWKHLESFLNVSKWGRLTGYHFDTRPGLCNFSVLGRNANTTQRKEYYQWDADTSERKNIAFSLNYYFGEKYNLEAVVSGETGIDIFPKGGDKSQILRDFNREDIIFFGDRTFKGGNDHSLARLLPTKQVHQVKNWRHTWQILKTLTSDSPQ